jgi:hypothetical protein
MGAHKSEQSRNERDEDAREDFKSVLVRACMMPSVQVMKKSVTSGARTLFAVEHKRGRVRILLCLLGVYWCGR